MKNEEMVVRFLRSVSMFLLGFWGFHHLVEVGADQPWLVFGCLVLMAALPAEVIDIILSRRKGPGDD